LHRHRHRHRLLGVSCDLLSSLRLKVVVVVRQVFVDNTMLWSADDDDDDDDDDDVVVVAGERRVLCDDKCRRDSRSDSRSMSRGQRLHCHCL